jgi:cobalt/nickel transport system permease protein
VHRLFAESNRNNLLTRLDGRVKLLSALALLVMVLTYHGFLFPLSVTALCIASCLALRIPLKRLLVRFSEPLFIVAVLIVIKLFFSGNEVIGTVRPFGIPISLHKDGLMDGLLIGARIIGAVSVMAALVSATPFTEVLASLAWLRVPRGIIEVTMFAYRYIFLLLDDAAVIYSAQKNRLGYSSLKRSFTSVGVLAGSLTLKAFDNSQHAATAMVQRGYDGRVPMAAQKPLKAFHLALSALFLVLMVLLWKI